REKSIGWMERYRSHLSFFFMRRIVRIRCKLEREAHTYMQVHTYLPHCFSPFCFQGGNHENSHPTAYHAANGRSKNARCAQEKGRTIHGRPQHIDGDRLDAGIHVGGPAQPDWKGLADSRSSL